MSRTINIEDMSIKCLFIKKDLMVYKLDRIEIPSHANIIFYYHFELVAGVDYINPDESDRQGFVEASNFVEHLQDVSFTVFGVDESLEKLVKEDGYEMYAEGYEFFERQGIKVFKQFAPLSEIEEYFSPM